MTYTIVSGSADRIGITSIPSRAKRKILSEPGDDIERDLRGDHAAPGDGKKESTRSP